MVDWMVKWKVLQKVELMGDGRVAEMVAMRAYGMAGMKAL